MNNKENLFIIRTYTKAELAHLYNPTAVSYTHLTLPTKA